MPAEEGGAGREEGIETRVSPIVQVVPVVFKKTARMPKSVKFA